MSLLSRPRTNILRLALLCAAFFAAASIAGSSEKAASSSLLDLSIPDLDHKLQECPFVQDLNAARLAAEPETSSLMKRVFAVLFPAGPAVNSLLATAYISGPPSPCTPPPRPATTNAHAQTSCSPSVPQT
jgi:zinc transporter 7